MSTEIKDTLVSTDWLLEHLDDKNLCIIDVTIDQVAGTDGIPAMQSAYYSYQASHIPGAQFADLLGNFSDQTSDLAFTLPGAEDFASAVSAIGVSNNSQVVIYTRSYSGLATRLWWMFKAFGFDRAAVLDGGFAKWEREGKPISNQPVEPIPAEFSAVLNPEVIATTDEVNATVKQNEQGSGNSCLIDTLPSEYFYGRAGDTYGYGRLGHIPGAINIPTENMLNAETGEFLAIEDIKKRYQQDLASFNGRHITYCGGGIAASQSFFALYLIGKKDIAMYDGSLAAWVKDSTRPLAVD